MIDIKDRPSSVQENFSDTVLVQPVGVIQEHHSGRQAHLQSEGDENTNSVITPTCSIQYNIPYWPIGRGTGGQMSNVFICPIHQGDYSRLVIQILVRDGPYDFGTKMIICHHAVSDRCCEGKDGEERQNNDDDFSAAHHGTRVTSARVTR
jgi:hypothetical protein